MTRQQMHPPLAFLYRGIEKPMPAAQTKPDLIRFSRQERRAAELMTVTGATRASVAKEMGLAPQTVKSLLHRARRRALAKQPALNRYRDRLATQAKSVHFKPFSLQTTDQV